MELLRSWPHQSRLESNKAERHVAEKWWNFPCKIVRVLQNWYVSIFMPLYLLIESDENFKQVLIGYLHSCVSWTSQQQSVNSMDDLAWSLSNVSTKNSQEKFSKHRFLHCHQVNKSLQRCWTPVVTTTNFGRKTKKVAVNFSWNKHAVSRQTCPFMHSV